jgi:hypothetical protein
MIYSLEYTLGPGGHRFLVNVQGKSKMKNEKEKEKVKSGAVRMISVTHLVPGGNRKGIGYKADGEHIA